MISFYFLREEGNNFQFQENQDMKENTHKRKKKIDMAADIG